MSLDTTDVDALHRSITEAIESTGGVTVCRPLCDAIEQLSKRKDSTVHDALGKSLGARLLHLFLDSANDLPKRRWSGLLLSELFRISQHTAHLLTETDATANDLKGLGTLAQHHQEKEDLKLVSCMIMKELSRHAIDQRFFWPGQAPPPSFSRDGSREWIAHLHGNLDTLSGSHPPQVEIFHPSGFIAGQDWYFDDQKGRIVMLLEDWLTIVVPPPAARHIFFIDVPLVHIAETTLLSDRAVELTLSRLAGPWTYIVNAKPEHTGKVVVEFAEPEEAKEALQILSERSPAKSKSKPHTPSQVLQQDSNSATKNGETHESTLSSQPRSDDSSECLDGSKDRKLPDQKLERPIRGAVEALQKRRAPTVMGISTPRLNPTQQNQRRSGASAAAPTVSRTRLGIGPSETPQNDDNEEDNLYGLRSGSHASQQKMKKKSQKGGSQQPDDHAVDLDEAEHNGTDEVDQIVVAPQERYTKKPPGRNNGQVSHPSHLKPAKNALKLNTTDPRESARSKTRASIDKKNESGDDFSVYDMPEESPGPTTPPKDPKKTKGKGKKKAAPKKSQPRTTLPSARRGRGPGRKKKEDSSNDDDEDGDYKTPQQLSPEQEQSGRLTRAAAARKSGVGSGPQPRTIEGKGERQSANTSAQPKIRTRKTQPAEASTEANVTQSLRSEKLHEQKEPHQSVYPAQLSDGETDNNSAHEPSPRPANIRSAGKSKRVTNAGDTQENALEISTGHGSESELTSLSPPRLSKQTQIKTEAKQAGNVAETPTERLKVGPKVTQARSKLPATASNKSANAGELFLRKPQIVEFGLQGPHNQGRRQVQNASVQATPFQIIYSAGKPRTKQEQPSFSGLIAEEEAIASRQQTQEPGTTRKRPAEDNLSHETHKRRLAASPDEDERAQHQLSSPAKDKFERRTATQETAASGKSSSPGSKRAPKSVDNTNSPIGYFASTHAHKPTVSQDHHSNQQIRATVVSQSDDGDGLPPTEMPALLESEGHASSPPAVKIELPPSKHHASLLINHQTKSAEERTPHAPPKGIRFKVEPYATQSLHLRQSPVSEQIGLHDQDILDERYNEILDSPGVPRPYRQVRARPKAVLSSNSKKMPEPPEAESKAITTHVPQGLLNTSKTLQTPAQLQTNPFRGTPSPEQGKDESHFMRKIRQQMKPKPSEQDLGSTNVAHGGVKHTEEEEDAERTLVDILEEDTQREYTDDSSTTAEYSADDEASEEHPEDMDWEASLKPHQRDMVDVLTRISRHFVRHLIDAETAIEDIVSDYNHDASMLIDQMEASHRKDYEASRIAVTEARHRISGALAQINKQVANNESQDRTKFLGKGWEKQAATSRKQISQLENTLARMRKK